MKQEANSETTMNIQWYPGHMTKTRRMIEADVKLVDAVCEILRPAADIYKSCARVVRERVHRKIAPQQIGAQAARKRHAVRPPVV